MARAERERHHDNGTTTLEIQSAAVEPEVDLVVLELSDWYHKTGGTMTQAISVEATGPVRDFSAYDVVGPGAKQQALLSWIGSSSYMDSVHNTFSTIMFSFTSAFRIIAAMAPAVNITVVFPDGTQITLEYEVVNAEAKVKEGTAKDSQGNVIPLSKDQLNGMTFDYSRDSFGYDRTRMSNWLQNFIGVPVSTSGGVWRYACVSAGNITTCTVHKF